MILPKIIESQSLPREANVGSCVYRLAFNDRYVIVKAKDHLSSVAAIQKAYNQFRRHSPSQRKPNNLYYHFFSYAEKHTKGEFRVDILLADKNAYKLLVFEQTELLKNRKDKLCLNSNADAYIPDFNDITGMYGWIPKQAVLNFRKWLKNKPKSK